MNAVEIEEAVSSLAEAPFDAESFPYVFLEALESDGETLACAYPDFGDHCGFFLPLAGISTVRQIRENAFDIKATSRLNHLYVELLKENPEWANADLGAAHDRNDETLKRIYIGRRVKNDTERLEKLFDLCTKMTINAPAAKKVAPKASHGRKKGEEA